MGSLPFRSLAAVALVGAATFPGSPLGFAPSAVQWVAFVVMVGALALGLGLDLKAQERRATARARIMERLFR